MTCATPVLFGITVAMAALPLVMVIRGAAPAVRREVPAESPLPDRHWLRARQRWPGSSRARSAAGASPARVRQPASSFRIEEPRVLQRVLVPVAALARVQHDGRADDGIQHQRRFAVAAIHDDIGIVIGLRDLLDRPIYG
jgi:hypothetical protein